jgi:lysosomal alpha-mannosidase
MLRRRRDYRPGFKLNQTEQVAGNYFPCNAAAAIRDEHAQLTVLVDASQGVASLRDGELELMVHRRVLKDDGRGVGEPLDETEFTTPYTNEYKNHGEHLGAGLVIRGTHTLFLTTPSSAAAHWRPRADRVFAPPLLAFSESSSFVPTATQDWAVQSALRAALPPNVQIITLQAHGASQILLRLAHQFGIAEDVLLSKPVSIDLSSLFSGFTITDVKELSLTANQNKTSILDRRLHAAMWHNDSTAPHPWRSLPAVHFYQDPTVTLGPLEIKTFMLYLSS